MKIKINNTNFKVEEREKIKRVSKVMKKNKEKFKVHRARHIFAQSVFDDKELGYALIDYMLFKERRRGYFEGFKDGVKKKHL